METESETIFCDRGVTFDEIIRDGKIGGKTAIISYLDIRTKQLTRQLSECEAGLDRRRLMMAIHAMRDARQIVVKLKAT